MAIYRYTLSPLIGPRCRHLPSCSEYADEAITRFGLWAGGWMALARILRCQPWGTHGLDFVPRALPGAARWWLPWRYGRWRGTQCDTASRHAQVSGGADLPRALYCGGDDRPTSWLLLILLSVLWGGSFFFTGLALRELPPLTVTLVRVGLGAALLLPLLKPLGGALPKTIAAWKPFFVMGLLNNVLPFSLLITGQTHISSRLASVLNATTPLFTVLVLASFGDEKLVAAPDRRRRDRTYRRCDAYADRTSYSPQAKPSARCSASAAP